ncbi:MAG: dehydrogenase [Bacteroidetes bacterium]|nr:dehydrogenase [Bacteroidota bacterium]MDA1121161.1 dehydrogenase [Bacteroidota bacterium]
MIKCSRLYKAYRIFLNQIITLLILGGCSSKVSNEGPSPVKTPEEELKTFQVENGFEVQLVASEPLVEEPVIMTFDGEGRLWVVEMRGFMNDIDGSGEDEPSGRVSILIDDDGDGQMDNSIIYIDSLIMPRAIALIKGGALIVENKALWITQDTDGDSKADVKTLIDPDYAGSALPEHSGNGLLRGIDNWYYNAKSRFRYRFVDGALVRDSTEFRGQWGISQDDKGRLFYNYNWSQLHADLVPPNYLSRNENHTPTTGIDHGVSNDRRIYPIRPNPAINRGYIPGTLDEEGKLLEFTAACSPFYYRETTFAEEYYGNTFVAEPSGNLVKRNVVKEDGLILKGYDPQPGREFLASTDERFRPVSFATGSDGALYIADMYRGLIQHGAYVTDYLRETTLSRKLDQPINLGRIWRVVPKNWQGSRGNKYSELNIGELVDYLSHPSGWHRDMAQKLLVETEDGNLSEPLTELALEGPSQWGRYHALWTMEGLGLLQPDLLFSLLSDENNLIRNAAFRLLEPFTVDASIKRKLGEFLLTNLRSETIDDVLQISLSSEVLSPEVSLQLLSGVLLENDTSALIRDAVMSSLENREYAFMQQVIAAPSWTLQKTGKAIFLEMLTTSVLRKNDDQEVKGLLAMVQLSNEWKKQALVTSMNIYGSASKNEPLKLPGKPEFLIPEDHQGIANLFDWPGKPAKEPTDTTQYQLDEQGLAQFALGRQQYLSSCSGCHSPDGQGMNRLGPPLVNSEWVIGNENRLVYLVLHGIEGPIEVNGKVYDVPEILPVMPAHSPLESREIASILTYIRNEWGNNAPAISGHTVGRIRLTSQGTVVPWTAERLKKKIEELEAKENQTPIN